MQWARVWEELASGCWSGLDSSCTYDIVTTVAKLNLVGLLPCNERAASSRTSIPWSATGSSGEDYLREVKLQFLEAAAVQGPLLGATWAAGT